MKIRNRIWNKVISLIPFLIAIPILIMLGLYFINKKNNKVEDIDVAKGLIKDIKIMRVAIDEYYQKTGTFPDLALNNEENEIEKIFYKTDSGIVYFKDLLKESSIPKTPAGSGLSASNKIYTIKNFDEATKDGGWNYNSSTGEIHVNLPENFLGQGIEWETY